MHAHELTMNGALQRAAATGFLITPRCRDDFAKTRRQYARIAVTSRTVLGYT